MRVTQRRTILYCSLSFFLLLADFLAKKLTLLILPYEGSSLPIFHDVLGIDLSLMHMTNKGAAWGVFSSFPELLIIFRIILIGALFYWLLFYSTTRKYQIAVLIILTGAIGNVVDFFLYGHVIDMIHFTFWGYDYPVFNLADSMIFLSTLFIIGSGLISDGR